MAKRKKMIRAGQLVLGIIYTAPLPNDPEHVRAAKSKTTTAAQQKANMKTSCRKCELLLACNFTGRDIVITLTYRDGDLPEDKATAVRRIRRFIRKLRAAREANGEALRYIYVTEHKHSDGRWHHHMVLNGTGADIDLIRELWQWGDDIELETLDMYGYEALAQYLTKEPREMRKVVGERMWSQSKGLKRPEVETDWAKDHETLTPPPGVIVLANETQQNEYGCYAYIKYLIPDYKPRKCRPSRRKKE